MGTVIRLHWWDVVRTTTDKLADVLNDTWDDRWKIQSIQYVGGRDWVVIAKADRAEDEVEA